MQGTWVCTEPAHRSEEPVCHKTQHSHTHTHTHRAFFWSHLPYTHTHTHTHTQSVLLIPPSLPAILHFLSPFHFLTSHSLSSSFLSGSFHHHSTKSSPSRPHTTLILLTMESLSPLPSWHTFSFGCQDAFLMPEGPRSTLGPLLFTLHIHTFDDIVQLITWNVIYLTIPTFVFLAQISLWLQPQIQMPTQHWHLGVDNLNSTTLKRNSFSFLFLIEGLSQYCVGFYHTSTWTSHRYTCAPSLLNIPPPPTLSHPSGGHRTLVWVPWITQHIPIGCLFYIGYCVCFHATLSIHSTLSFLPPPHVLKSVLYVCISTAALQTASSVPSF